LWLTGLACISLGAYMGSFPLISIFILILLNSYPLIISINIIMLCCDFHSKGYFWINPADTIEIRKALKNRTYNIPPRDEIATLPGYKDGDIDALIRWAQLREKTKQPD
jgi:hypothetical protein